MLKSIIKFSLVTFSSIVFVYFISDKFLLPYFLYVDEITMPNIIGHNISTAKILLNQKDLEFKIQYTYSENNFNIGIVTHSNPLVGKTVKKGTIIDLKVLGEREKYDVPNLKFKSKSIALNMLKSMGIKVDTVIFDYHDIICTNPEYIDTNNNYDLILKNCNKINKNIVWKQYPKSGNKFLKSDGITLYVSKGLYAPELYNIPNLIDLDLNEAINKINSSGLLLGTIKYINSLTNNNSNKIIDQYPYGECKINKKINLTVEK